MQEQPKENIAAPVKRGPGRPRKVIVPVAVVPVETVPSVKPKPTPAPTRKPKPKPKPKTTRRVGRPRVQLTAEAIKQVEQLAQVGCIHEEIAAIVGISSDILAERYSDAIAKGKLKFKGSLRMLQFKLAKGGSASMAIFLGKNYLDQSDKIESKEEISGPGGAPIEMKVIDKDAIRAAYHAIESE